MENPLQPCQTAQLAGLFATRGLCPAMCLKERFLTLMTDLNQGEGQEVALVVPRHQKHPEGWMGVQLSGFSTKAARSYGEP